MGAYTDDEWLAWIDQLSAEDYVVIDEFLPKDIYQTLRSFFLEHLKQDDFSKAGIGAAGNRQIAASIRGDYIYWLTKERDVTLLPVFQLLEELIQKLNRYCFLSLSGYEFHLAHYPSGTFYRRHLDQFRERNNRMISIIIYLNELWNEGDGGELIVYRDNEVHEKIQPLANRCAMFRSDCVEHEVSETRISRYSLTGWLLYQPPGLGQILG
ncbi:2OG-Fe(II) oxygenase [Fulvivirga sedimenti]|uniref:2OG-Fe(II) oxygenase n=1 Tax=Fulvivirga sedimenti TaxID=2879465 RepID=A0A9X1KZQ2_9BACT|nr:2OG-Fe(II) oxygenase [Fulvivirga sedimenti]MCA6078545.1 2OG-Fe(II) oxygenase [Fulvivirga sedimenti]